MLAINTFMLMVIALILQVADTEQVLTSWAKRVAELRSLHDWLLFFSVPKLLLLHRLLIEAGAPAERAGPPAEGERARRLAEVVREVSFLCENSADTREHLMRGVKVGATSVCVPLLIS